MSKVVSMQEYKERFFLEKILPRLNSDFHRCGHTVLPIGTLTELFTIVGLAIPKTFEEEPNTVQIGLSTERLENLRKIINHKLGIAA